MSVKMSLTRGQYAWFSTYEAKNTTSIQKQNTELKMENHQRLNVEKQSPDWLIYWLVGLTEGDGTFSIDKQHKSKGYPVWNLVFKISLKQSNIRALMKAKAVLGVGKIETTPDGMVTLRIRDRTLLKKYIFPIFDRIPLLSSKHYDYIRLRQVARLLDNSSLSREERHLKITAIYSLASSREAVAPIWHQKLFFCGCEFSRNPDGSPCLEGLDLKKPQIETVLSLPWISGFLEADGSFFIVKKDETRFCHAFGVTQTGNFLLMQALRSYFKIGAQVLFRHPVSFQGQKRQGYYKLETTNWRSLQRIREIMLKNLLGIKAVEFRIWERSMKSRGNPKKLEKIQQLLRKMRKRWK